MIKRFTLALALVMALAMPAAAATDLAGVYVGAKFIDSYQSKWGNDFAGSQSGNTVGGGVFVGYDFFHKFDLPLRVELEYALRSDMEVHESGRMWGNNYGVNTKWGLQTLMANAYYDFRNSTAFTPYVGAGLGMGFVTTEYDMWASDGVDTASAGAKNTSTVFAWNVGAGCSYAFSDNVSADLAYRYLSHGEDEVRIQGMSLTSNGSAHEFSLGLRLTF